MTQPMYAWQWYELQEWLSKVARHWLNDDTVNLLVMNW